MWEENVFILHEALASENPSMVKEVLAFLKGFSKSQVLADVSAYLWPKAMK